MTLSLSDHFVPLVGKTGLRLGVPKRQALCAALWYFTTLDLYEQVFVLEFYKVYCDAR